MNLFNLIKETRTSIEKYGTQKIHNEITTRYVLIDPILKALNWNLADPDQVRYEEGDSGGRWDYKLGDRLLIESKKLGSIKPRDSSQLTNYLKHNNMQHGILTDGDTWSKWTVYSSGSISQDFSIRMTLDPLSNIFEKINNLDRQIILDRIPKPLDYDSTLGANPPKNGAINIDENETLSDVGIPISKFRPSGKPPIKLVCMHERPITCTYWIDVLVNAACYLIDNNHINKTDCPIRSGPKNFILNTTNHNHDGVQMRFFKQIRPGFYLNTNLNPQSVISNTKKILNHAKLDLDNFSIIQISNSTKSSQKLKSTHISVPLSKFHDDFKLPVKLLYPDGTFTICNFWIDLLYNMTIHLIEKNYITDHICPIPKQVKNPIVTLGKPFSNTNFYKKTRGTFYLYTKLDKKCILKSMLKLLEYVNLNAENFMITTINTSTPTNNHSKSTNTANRTNIGTLISEFQPGNKLPVTLICPNDIRIVCDSYAKILVNLIDYLIKNNHINESNCPIPYGLKNPLVTTKKRNTGPSKIRYVLLHNVFYVNVNFNRLALIKNTTKIIKHLNLNPLDFRIAE